MHDACMHKLMQTRMHTHAHTLSHTHTHSHMRAPHLGLAFLQHDFVLQSLAWRCSHPGSLWVRRWWCLPDANLLRGTCIKPIVEASFTFYNNFTIFYNNSTTTAMQSTINYATNTWSTSGTSTNCCPCHKTVQAASFPS